MNRRRVNPERRGVEVIFPDKPAGDVIAQLKAQGFGWNGRERLWYATDADYRRQYLATIAEQVEDVPASGLTFAETMEEKREKAEARRERYEGWAESAQAEAGNRFAAARRMGDGIPFGQPILVGHHSEGRDRNYRKRIDAHISRGVEAAQRAEYHARKAETAGVKLDGYDRPDFLTRRIKETEALLRKLRRNQEQYPSQRWEPQIAEAEDKLNYCRARLEELGGVKFGPHNISKGMTIIGRHGPAVVRRVNPTSVTVDYLDPVIICLNPQKCPYERIRRIVSD